jgi:aminopeptidase N
MKDMDKESLKDALIPVFIMNETESEIPFVANNLVDGMLMASDRDQINIYKEGIFWVGGSDSEEGTQNLVDSLVQLGIQYKQYDLDRVAISYLQQILEAKKMSSYENKDKLVEIVEEGLNRLQ